MITYRDLETPEELVEVEKLQQRVWQMEDIAVVPDRMIQVVLHTGGHVMGAYDGETMIGFTMALASKHGDKWRLWSHMAGVLNEYRGQGVGFALKARQRKWALRHGYDTIAWTFDPLQRVNANFNLRRLGAKGVLYHPDFYGEMKDELNRGMPSDRLEVEWDLASARVVDHADGMAQPVLVQTHDVHFIVTADDNGDPLLNIPQNFTNLCYFVETPYDLMAVRARGLDAVVAWRNAHQQAMKQAFAADYSAVDFVNSDTRCWYVFYKNFA
jgi:predicted GNAT superfamily acetyltransferase